MKKPVRIAITGAAGNIGYAIAFRIASGSLFGPDQPVILHLIEIAPAFASLRGVEMELQDCAFPLLTGIVVTTDLDQGFGDVDYAFLIGSRPRSKGMERSDLLTANGKIFKPQGQAINRSASRDVHVLVVGNPANTNALIAMHNAPNLQPYQFSSMMRLDHNRAVSMLARQVDQHSTSITKMTVWGNHSLSQVPDIQHCLVAGTPATELVDDAWYRDEFVPRIQRRGAEVIETRGASSAASAASAAVDHMRDWIFGSTEGDWVSMGVLSDGRYDIAKDLMYSYPVTTSGGSYSIADGLTLNDYSVELIKMSEAELLKERDAVKDLL